MADENKPYFYEFLYRGRPPGSAEQPAWQVTLGAVIPDPFGGAATFQTQTLNMQQAEKAGWALPEIIAAINADMLAKIDSEKEELERLRTRVTQLEQDRDLLLRNR